MALVTKRSTMTFFSDPSSHYSHRVRIVLAEKGVTVDVIDTNPDEMPDEILEYNPYNTLPTLVDRELALFEPQVMMEYLDERFPHPPLLPVYPVDRAKIRLYIHRIERDWCTLVDTILAAKGGKGADDARKEFRESLIATAPVFGELPFFMYQEFTVADCCIAPILWRLPLMGIELPEKQVKPLLKYMDRLFSRESFRASLSDIEQDMRN